MSESLPIKPLRNFVLAEVINKKTSSLVLPGSMSQDFIGENNMFKVHAVGPLCNSEVVTPEDVVLIHTQAGAIALHYGKETVGKDVVYKFFLIPESSICGKWS